MWQLRINALMVETRSEQENQRSMESSNVDDQKHEPRSCLASWLESHRSCAPTTSLTNGMYASKKNHAMNRIPRVRNPWESTISLIYKARVRERKEGGSPKVAKKCENLCEKKRPKTAKRLLSSLLSMCQQPEMDDTTRLQSGRMWVNYVSKFNLLLRSKSDQIPASLPLPLPLSHLLQPLY